MIDAHLRTLKIIENEDGTSTVIAFDDGVEIMRATAATSTQAIATVEAHAPHVETETVDEPVPEPQQSVPPSIPAHIAEIL